MEQVQRWGGDMMGDNLSGKKKATNISISALIAGLRYGWKWRKRRKAKKREKQRMMRLNIKAERDAKEDNQWPGN